MMQIKKRFLTTFVHSSNLNYLPMLLLSLFTFCKNDVQILEILKMGGRLVWTIPMVAVYDLYAKTGHLTLSEHQG